MIGAALILILIVQPFALGSSRYVGLDDTMHRKRGDTLNCKSMEHWLQPQSDQYRGLRVARDKTWGEIQDHVDALAACGCSTCAKRMEETVQVEGGSKDGRARALSEGAVRLLAQLRGPSLPVQVIRQIHEDIKEIGMVLANMVPTKALILRLEILGEYCAPRWHQDDYVARVIVSYNCDGTNYVNHDNVNFLELEHRGINTQIIRNKSKVFSAGVGDILFIKGRRYPRDVNGLVHKSPKVRYHTRGAVKHRLCLKVDVPTLH